MDYKFARPRLTEPKIKSKMIKILKEQPGPNDYWAPTKSFMQNIYDMFIKENLTFIFFLIIIIIFLLYRYRMVQNEREYDPENAPSSRPTKKINWNALIAQQLAVAEASRPLPPPPPIEIESPQQKPQPMYPSYPIHPGGYLMGGRRR